MARIVIGNGDGVLALTQVRRVLADLSAEWPDVQILQRTIRNEMAGRDLQENLLEALQDGRINIAVQRLDTLPPALPEELSLAAVGRRLEPRSTLVGRGPTTLAQLAADSLVGVSSHRDRVFLETLQPDLRVALLRGSLDEDLSRLGSDLDALILPCSTLLALERRQHIGPLLEAEAFTPAPGQGALGFIVREDDDLAFEIAYSLQHRPSFDRARAERSFARHLPSSCVAGALASVSDDGDLALFGAVVRDGTVLQATTSGEASEAEDLGRELAQDMLEQLG